jgi:hypothetical protein
VPGWKVAGAARKGSLDLAAGRRRLRRGQELIWKDITARGSIHALRAAIDVPLVGVEIWHV